MREQHKRLALLMAAAVFQGASIGPLIELAIDFDPRYVFYASIVIVFVSNKLDSLQCYGDG